jgi:hypothetical protein
LRNRTTEGRLNSLAMNIGTSTIPDQLM